MILHTINTVNSLYGRIRTSRGQSQWLITRDLWVNPFELVANGTQTPNYPAIRPRKRNRMALYYINRKNWHFLFTKMPFHHFPPLFKTKKNPIFAAVGHWHLHISKGARSQWGDAHLLEKGFSSMMSKWSNKHPPENHKNRFGKETSSKSSPSSWRCTSLNLIICTCLKFFSCNLHDLKNLKNLTPNGCFRK